MKTLGKRILVLEGQIKVKEKERKGNIIIKGAKMPNRITALLER